MVLLVALLVAVVAAQVPVSVQTKSGVVVGVRDDIATSFLNIPFAQPPVGPLRWADPLPVKVAASFEARGADH